MAKASHVVGMQCALLVPYYWLLVPGLCLVFGLRDMGGGVGRYEGIVWLKWASNFWMFIQNFICLQRKIFFGFGSVGGLAWVGGSATSSPPPPLPAWISTSLAGTPVCLK